MIIPKIYDLAVIGAGPAGIVGATTAASLGATVVLIDRYGDLGGAGANTGTVPSKTLRETALALSGIQSRNLYGVDLSLRREATVGDLMHRERAVKKSLNRMLAQLVEASSVEFIVGDAQFEDAHTVSVQSDFKSTLVRAEKVLIATGSSPHRPTTFPFDKPGVYDSDTILELETIPKSLAVVGAGAVGSEYACTFAALGTKVYLIDSREVLLPFLDTGVSQALMRAVRASGIEMHCRDRVAECTSAGGEVTLRLESGRIVQTQAVLVAAGRRSNTSSLNVAVTGVAPGERGDVKVDKHYRTAVPHIYAAGDVIGFPALASTGMQQARRAMSIAFGPADELPARDILPAAVYTTPEVAMAGQTEQEVRAAGLDYVVGRARYLDNPRGCIIGETEGFLKLILRRDNLKLLGVHAIGEHASELVHISLIAMSMNCNAAVFSKLCFNVPTLGAMYQDATWRLINEKARTMSAKRMEPDMSHNSRRTARSLLLSTPERRRFVGAFLVAALLLLAASLTSKGAELRAETLHAWGTYIQAQNARVARYSSTAPFLWSDQSPERLRRLETGEIVVARLGDHPRKVPEGLIHHWIGAVFLPGARLNDVLSVVRDYGKYKELYAPNVIASRLVHRTDTKDTFSLRILNNAIVAKFAVDIEFQDTFRRIDNDKWDSISYATRVREVENYGTPDEHEGISGKGRGLLWQLCSISRFEQRDGGVYMELEAIALSRDIPGALRWVLDPLVCRISRTALQVSLLRMEGAVLEASRTAKGSKRNTPATSASSNTLWPALVQSESSP